jgi:hypothetical protein
MLFELDSRPALVASGALLGAAFAVAFLVPPAPVAMVAPVIVRPVVQVEQLPQAGVIVPPLLRDAEPWPRGMVIVPPPTGDRMAILIPADLVSGSISRVVQALRWAAPGLL